jgi:hypothetical protein
MVIVRIGVSVPVSLDNETSMMRGEVGEVGTDGYLPPEVKAQSAELVQDRPEFALARGG